MSQLGGSFFVSIRKNACLILDDAPVESWDAMLASYLDRWGRFGFCPRTLYYSRDDLHQQRLVQAETIMLRCVAAGDTLLDVGCGFGELIPHLPDCSYRGIDLIGHFVSEARKRHPGREFAVQNFLEMDTMFDWVAMVGIMGTLPLPESMLLKAMAQARKGVIVDFIDARRYQGPLNHYDMGCCVNFLVEHGAAQVHVFTTPAQPWTFVLAEKHSLFAEPEPA